MAGDDEHGVEEQGSQEIEAHHEPDYEAGLPKVVAGGVDVVKVDPHDVALGETR